MAKTLKPTIGDDFFETKEEKEAGTALKNSIDKLQEEAKTIDPELREGFKKVVDQITDLSIVAGAVNISTEKAKRNIEAILLFLKEMNSTGTVQSPKSVIEGVLEKINLATAEK